VWWQSQDFAEWTTGREILRPFFVRAAKNPFLVAGLPALNLGDDCFVRQVEKRREAGDSVIPDSVSHCGMPRIIGSRPCALQRSSPRSGRSEIDDSGHPAMGDAIRNNGIPGLLRFSTCRTKQSSPRFRAGRPATRNGLFGRLARKKAGESPGRVVHSAKSWLCHHTSDRSARFLPLGSDDIARNSKISPVRASALILDHLKGAWNSRFADAGADFEFDSQEITVTVPASFDAAAQRLTLLAAAEAGFRNTRLLEEPQATFYCWLEQHDFATDLGSKLPNDNNETHRVLVSTLVVVPRISAYSNCARAAAALPRESSARQ